MIRGEIMFVQFNGQRRCGWTEDHFIRGTDNLKTAIRFMGELAAARSQLLGAGVTIPMIRVSDTDRVNDTQIIPGLLPAVQLRQQKNEKWKVEPLVPVQRLPDFGVLPSAPPTGESPGQPREGEPTEYLAPKLSDREATRIRYEVGQVAEFGAIVYNSLANAALQQLLRSAVGLPVRVGTTDQIGVKELYNPNFGEGVDANDLGGLIADQPETGLLVRLDAGTNGTCRRSHLLRGMPDALVRTDRDSPIRLGGPVDNNFHAAFASYALVLMSGRFGVRSLDIGPNNPERPIQGWALAGMPPFVQATIPALNAKVGDQVKINGASVGGPNGERIGYSQTLRVRSVQGDVYTFVSTKVKGPFASTLAMGRPVFKAGIARIVRYVVEPYTAVSVRRWGRGKVGPGFDAAKVPKKRKKKGRKR